MMVPGYGVAPSGAEVDATPLVHDTYRSEGTFTAETSASSPLHQGIVLRYRDNQSFTYAYRYPGEVGVIRYDSGVSTLIRAWGGVHPDPLPAIPAGDMTMIVELAGGDYTLTINGTLIGTGTDPSTVGRSSTVHGLNGYFNVQPGAQPVPRFTRMTMAFDLTDHIRFRSTAPESTRDPVEADHTYQHLGALRSLLYPLEPEPGNPAPVSTSQLPLALQPIISEDTGLIDEFGNDIVDEDGNVLTF